MERNRITDMNSNEKAQFLKKLIIGKIGWGIAEEEAILLLSFLDSLTTKKEGE